MISMGNVDSQILLLILADYKEAEFPNFLLIHHAQSCWKCITANIASSEVIFIYA